MNDRILSRDITEKVGKDVKIAGWVQTIRLHANVTFFDVRDRTGVTQIVISKELINQTKDISEESVIEVEGKVVERPQTLVNPNIISGKVEIQAKKISVLARSKVLPFPLNDDSVDEEIRLKYRYLDLRSDKNASILKQRHKVNQIIHYFLTKEEFVEVETPYISKSTPEGARDFLVPSRIEKGKFYALPQSPQQYKQLLMVAGLERYYQIARCFRDEDSRGDRQPEFFQIDIELSFPTQDEILNLTENLMLEIIKNIYPDKKLTYDHFPRITYQETIKKYKTDKPDLRKNKSDDNELAFVFITDFPLFEWKESEKRFGAMHHPFTQPHPDFIDNFEKKPQEAKALQYDLSLNGNEIAGGSIRISDPQLLSRVFKFIGIKEIDISANFGHLLEAFKYGAPPHGGIAIGLDRLLKVLMNEDSIRKVIPFPKFGDGKDLMMNAPAEVSDDQLKELGIKII